VSILRDLEEVKDITGQASIDQLPSFTYSNHDTQKYKNNNFLQNIGNDLSLTISCAGEENN
jgi:hypothetical protein